MKANNGIKGISFENFRVFKEKSDIELASITILTGANSSGKSTVIKGLKLFQNSCEQQERQSKQEQIPSTLGFEESTESVYRHQLGDFEMVLNNENLTNKEITITYRLPESYWGHLFVENIFCINEDSILKDGKLKQTSVYVKEDKENIVLYKIDDETEYFNSRFILKKFLSLYMELEEYETKFEEYVVSVKKEEAKTLSIKDGDEMQIKDYKGIIKCCYTHTYGKAREGTYICAYHPEITQSFCDHIGVDYDRFQFFENTWGISHHEIDKSQIDLRKIETLNVYEPLWNNPEIFEQIEQIPFKNYDQFEQNLWELLIQKYPEILDDYDFKSFSELFADLDDESLFANRREEGTVWDQFVEGKDVSINAIKEYVKSNSSENFKDFLQKLTIDIIDEESTTQIKDRESKSKKIKNLESILLYLHCFEYYLFSPNEKINLFSDAWRKKIKPSRIRSFLFQYTDDSVHRRSTTADLLYLTYIQMQLFYKNMFFVESVRANTQRLYTYTSQGTSFNEFLRKFIDKDISGKSKDFLEKWVKEFEIGDGIAFEIEPGVGAKISILRGEKKLNIVDLGYGITQFLPILFHVSDISTIKPFDVSKYRLMRDPENYTKTIVIEEPEAHLHPKFQSKLADLFVDAQKEFGLSFIIETHSEYLIRKLQYLTAKGDIKPEDTVINYVDSADPAKRASATDPQIRTIHINPNGELTQPFGSGFYDEADNLAMKLWSYSEK